MKRNLSLFIILFGMFSFSSCHNEEPEIIPTARFSYTTRDLTVSFIDQSANASVARWDFGDGSSQSSERNPVHTYAKVGSYNVTLKVQSSTGNWDSYSQSITLMANASDYPTASFSYAPLTPYENQKITFTNNSKKASSYVWDFGNNKTSTSKSPTTTMAAGSWTVTLTAYNTDKTLKDVSTKTINVLPAPPIMYITKYQVNSIDFEDASGRYWDDTSKAGPDIFIKQVMRDGTATNLSESTHQQNVTTGMLPYTRNLGWKLTYFNAKYKIRLFDYDTWSDDWMADFTFVINDYIPEYPSQITLKSGKFSITLFVEWLAK